MRTSSGLLMYRLVPERDKLEVFLVHPGGPLFARKKNGHWSIPKGEPELNEEPLQTAIREFQEEVGMAPSGPYLELGWIKQKGGKIVHAWAFVGDWKEAQTHQCNMCRIQWPPDSGKWITFPEVDEVGFFDLASARKKLKETQHPFLDRLVKALNSRPTFISEK